MVRSVIDIEGPVHSDIVAQRIAESFNVRLGKRIREKIDRAIMTAATRDDIDAHKGFLADANIKLCAVRCRDSADSIVKQADHLPPTEIIEAIKKIVKSSIAIELEEVIDKTLRILGIYRTTDNYRKVIRSVIEEEITPDTGIVVVDDMLRTKVREQ